MNNALNVAIGISIAAALLYSGCEKKKVETKEASVPETAKTADYSYTVSAFKGNVSWSPDDETWQPVKFGLGIAKGGYAETGETSAATLSGTLGDIVMLGEKAKVQLLIEKLEKQASGGSLAVRGVALLKGMARFAITKGIGTFVVETPSAHIKVKGTDFIVTYNEKSGGTDVRVKEGSVAVDDKKQPGKTFSLSKGQALLGGGTASPVERPMTTKDSAVFKELQTIGQSNTPTQSSLAETPEAIRARLAAESREGAGKTTAPERAAAQASVDKERAVSQRNIDSVKAGYQAASQAEKDTFANRKAAATAVIDSTKERAQSALDAERARFREATSSVPGQNGEQGGASDGAFDELNKRKAGR
jgi:FecR protein